jgi:hypothetical protein
MYTCRECESEINQATELCPHCGADLSVPPAGEVVDGKKASLGKILLRWGLLLGVMFAALWSFLWFVVSPRTGHVALEAETQAVQAMEAVHLALNEYAAAQGGGYPQTLEPLGPVVRLAAQQAQGQGYQLQYAPGTPNADGAIRSYALEARAANYGYRNFYTDATGVVRATSENREANGQDPPIR